MLISAAFCEYTYINGRLACLVGGPALYLLQCLENKAVNCLFLLHVMFIPIPMADSLAWWADLHCTCYNALKIRL
jgi:hypothetical protein